MYDILMQKIIEYDNILIYRHVNPDGDSLGSQFGLKLLIEDNFPTKKVYAIGNNRTDSLGIYFPNCIDDTKELAKDSLIITVDAANSPRIDGKYFMDGKELIKIDHHVVVDSYGTINIEKPEASSAAEMIAEFYQSFSSELYLSPLAASYLYYGIVTDTSRFLHATTSAHTLRVSAMLIDAKADVQGIYTSINTRDEYTLRIMSYIFSHYQKTDKGVAYYIFDEKTLKDLEIDRQMASELIYILADVAELPIYVAFTEDAENGIWRASMRSKNTPIDHVANKYGGGGHKFACGATLYDPLNIQNMIIDLNNLL